MLVPFIDELTSSQGVAMQLYYAARILLLSHEPNQGGLGKYLERQTVIQRCVECICGIATTLKDDASSLMSSQALFIGKCRSNLHGESLTVL